MTFMVPVTKEADLLEHPERNVTVPVAFSNPRGSGCGPCDCQASM
jgi:hypothetical protein